MSHTIELVNKSLWVEKLIARKIIIAHQVTALTAQPL